VVVLDEEVSIMPFEHLKSSQQVLVTCEDWHIFEAGPQMALGSFGEPEQRELDQKIGQEVVIRAYLHTLNYQC
jgi:hypothetical protein